MTGATIPEGSVVITPTEMYREMLATHQAVRDVSGKLDSALGDTARRLEGHDKDIEDHETRIRHGEQTYATKAEVSALETQQAPRISALEKRVWAAAGAVGLIIGGSSVAATLLAGSGR